MATPQAPQKTPVADVPQAALPLPPAAPREDHDLVLVAPTPELNPRNQILKAIAARSNADADAAAAESLPETDDDGVPVTPVAAPVEAVEAAPAEDAPAPVPAADAAPAAPAEAPAPVFDPNQEYELTVNGKPIKVKGSQIIERGQQAIRKETAADYKLELATKLLAEAEAQRKAVPAAPAPEQPAQITDAELAQAIQFGTQDQATAAVAELTRRKGGEVTKESVQQMLMQSMPALVQQQLAFQEGVEFVKTEYADLLADPYLKPLFILRENEMRKAGDARSFKELYKAIGDDMRTHFNRPKTTSAAPAPAARSMEQKVAAKAAAPAAPKLASARMEAPGEAKPLSREEVFEKMRRARGQGQAPRTVQ